VQSNRWCFLTCGFDDTERPSSQPIDFMYRRNGSAKVSSTSFRLGRRCLLRARRERPSRRTAEKGDELAASRRASSFLPPGAADQSTACSTCRRGAAKSLGTGRCRSRPCRHTMRREAAALRDFNPAYVRFGSWPC